MPKTKPATMMRTRLRLAACLSSLLISGAGSATAAGAATIDDLLQTENRARQQRDTPAPAPVAAPFEYLPTTFEVDGIFGVENQLYADVVYNGESIRVAQGDRIGPCVVNQIAGSLGKGVELQVAPPPPPPPAPPAPAPDPGKTSAKVAKTGKATKATKAAKAAIATKADKPIPASRCPTAYWTEPGKAEAANATSIAATPVTPVIPSITEGIPPGAPAAPAPAISVIPLVKKN